ncbi:MAG: hypothetical protein GEU98_08060 [Pseudonocardiaceae bacterium]|nr:hypothetical protein [Pseudonocardiaceae bacterium]
MAAAEPAPVPIRLLLSVAPFVCGLLLVVTGYLGWQERLRRNRFAGVRTSATMRSEDAFRVANRVAGLPVLVAGLVGILTGVLTLAMSTESAVVVTVIVGLLGLVVIGLAGGLLGHRAAAATATPSGPAGCPSCVGCGGGGCALR